MSNKILNKLKRDRIPKYTISSSTELEEFYTNVVEKLKESTVSFLIDDSKEKNFTVNSSVAEYSNRLMSGSEHGKTLDSFNKTMDYIMELCGYDIDVAKYLIIKIQMSALPALIERMENLSEASLNVFGIEDKLKIMIDELSKWDKQ